LHTRFAIPSNYQLHAAKFAGGHGNPSTDPTWNRAKHLRGEVMQVALAHIAATTGVAVGAVYRRTTARRHAYAHNRADVYRRLIAHLDARLAINHDHGLVFSDSDGSDRSYAAAHRALTLDQRRVVEDPQFPGSAKNMWLQLAGLVAFSSAGGRVRVSSCLLWLGWN